MTYAEKLGTEDWRLDWSLPAVSLYRWVRAGHAWTTFRDRRLRVLTAHLRQADDSQSAGPLTQTPGELVDGIGGLVNTGSGLLELVDIQPEGKGTMRWREFANGAHPADGELLG